MSFLVQANSRGRKSRSKMAGTVMDMTGNFTGPGSPYDSDGDEDNPRNNGLAEVAPRWARRATLFVDP